MVNIPIGPVIVFKSAVPNAFTIGLFQKSENIIINASKDVSKSSDTVLKNPFSPNQEKSLYQSESSGNNNRPISLPISCPPNQAAKAPTIPNPIVAAIPANVPAPNTAPTSAVKVAPKFKRNICASGFKTVPKANPHTILPIFFIEIAPITIATVSSSRFPKKSMNASNMAFLSISFMVVAIKSKIPSTHTFIVFANAPKSNVLKKLLMPSAMLYPNCLKSNVSPNDKAEYTTVFNALAIVFPTSPNRVFPLYPSNKPLRNSARPVPKFLAFSYAPFQSMPSIALIKVSLIVLPSFLNVSISLSNGNTSPVFFH